MTLFANTTAAFTPFFDDTVKLTASRTEGRTICGSFAASVMPITLDDPLFESDAASNRKKFSVLIAAHGPRAWDEAFFGSKPQIGDVLELKSGFKTAITKVSPVVGDWWEVEVREI